MCVFKLVRIPEDHLGKSLLFSWQVFGNSLSLPPEKPRENDPAGFVPKVGQEFSFQVSSLELLTTTSN